MTTVPATTATTATTASPVLPVHRQAIYNPGRLTDAEVKATFIARQNLFHELEDDIRASRPGGRPQHHLVIGQRGMGKTTLLRRLDVSLREDPSLTTFVPLSFPEEQWTIDRLSKLWLNCLDSLADTLEREARSSPTIDAIDSAVDSLRRDPMGEDLLAEEAEREFLRRSKAIGCRPVLLIDNLDLVFNRLETHERKRLRSSLMAAGAPILIGACVSPPAETTDYSAPFYDHFKTHYLERLSLEEMQEVLRRLAEQASQPELLRRISEEKPRLFTLHALTGGNPRTTTILFQILCKGFSKEAYQDLEALLDWVTPLYKARFEEMAPQAQMIVSTLATNWEPMSAGQVGAATRLENRQVSPQLNRLSKVGIVEVVPIDPEDRVGPLTDAKKAGRNGYQLAERFFNIWFLMRQSTRRDRRNLIYLTRFIECIHTPVERAAMARDLLSKRPLSHEESIYGLALEPTVSEHGLRYELHDHVQQEIVDAGRRLKQRIDELIDPSEIPEHRYAFAELRAKLEEAVPLDTGIAPEEFADAVLGSVALLDRRDAIASQDLDESKVRELLAAAEEDLRLNERQAGAEAAGWYCNLLRSGTLVDLSDPVQFESAVVRADSWEKASLCVARASSEVARGRKTEAVYVGALEQHPDRRWIWVLLGDRYRDLKRFDEAEKTYLKAIEAQGDVPRRDLWIVWGKLGRLHQFELGQHPDAEQAYLNAIEVQGDNTRPEAWWVWLNLGSLYQDELGRYPEAEQAYLKAIEVQDDSPSAETWTIWDNLGLLYQTELGRHPEAEQAYLKAIEVQGDSPSTGAWNVWNNLGSLYRDNLDRYPEAEHAYLKATELEAGKQVAWNNLGLLLADHLGRAEEAESAFRKAIEADPEDTLAPQYNLVSVLRDQLGRLPEAMEIAREYALPEAPTLRAGIALHPALFAVYQDHWPEARDHLATALDLIADHGAFPQDTFPGWMRATAVLIHLDYGDRLLTFLRERGDDQRLRPWYEAIRAQLRGDRRYLRNIPAEMRDVAGHFFDHIHSLLKVLPDSTRRWSPHGGPKSNSRKRRSRG